MFSSAIDVLRVEALSLQAYTAATHSLRIAISRVQPALEASKLEQELLDAADIAPDLTRWRVMEHSLVVGRLYAIYETFCESLLSDWIDFLTTNFSYSDLPEKMIEYYPHGFSAIMTMLPSPRYPSLTREGMISRYHGALQGVEGYSLNSECLVHHKNNLRLEELSDIFGRCGLEAVGEWAAKSPDLVSALPNGNDRALDQIKSRLSDFIQYRNDSSHGGVSPDEILGHEELDELVDFIMALANSIDSFVKWKIVEKLLKLGEAHAVGHVTEVFPKSNACICVTEKISVSAGQAVLVRKAGNFYEDEIISIRHNDLDVDSYKAEPGVELGFRLGRLPAKGSKVFSIKA